jgi:hypothetical protein
MNGSSARGGTAAPRISAILNSDDDMLDITHSGTTASGSSAMNAHPSSSSADYTSGEFSGAVPPGVGDGFGEGDIPGIGQYEVQ